MSITLDDITAEAVIAAAREFGLRLVDDTYWVDGGGGLLCLACALGVLARKRTGHELPPMHGLDDGILDDWLGLRGREEGAFSAGFAGHDYGANDYGAVDDEARAWNQRGLEIREAVIAAGLMEP